MQLSLDFQNNINKPWWMGLVCKPMHYFHLLSQNIHIQDLMKPWKIEDYQKTQIGKPEPLRVKMNDKMT